jgi:uncharacterized phiE125 gp8 family phage protein
VSSLVLVEAPEAEPVSLAEAKLHLRQDITDDDTLIGSLVTAARRYCEKRIGQQFVTATWRLAIDAFPCGVHGGLIELPNPPLVEVDSITYVDTNGEVQTLDESFYQVDASSRPGRLAPVYGQRWPSARRQLNAVTIDFVAGYGAAAAVPETIKQAILLLVGHWYANREAVVVGTINGPLQIAVEALLGVEWDGSVSLEGVDE